MAIVAAPISAPSAFASPSSTASSGRLGSGLRRISAPSQEGRPRLRHAKPRRPHARPRRSHARRHRKPPASHGDAVEALALDTTGSSVIPVDENLEPLDDYYLWCDHRAWREAAEITAAARAPQLPAIDWCGGIYSSEWGWAKLLHWLRNNPEKRARFATALEHCDMVAAVLCGVTDPAQVPRSVCAMGHKWMWSAALGGLPPEEFLAQRRPGAGRRARQARRPLRDFRPIAGHLSPQWADEAGPARRHPDSRRRLRRPLGRRRRGRPSGRRGQRRRNLHLHHRHRRKAQSGSRSLRRSAGLGASRPDRHRSRTLRHRRHLRCHRPPRRQPRSPSSPRPGKLSRRRDRPAAHVLGQRRPHRAGESRT